MQTREIAVLDQQTIDKIAAGEVIERPASVVKELVENAIDADAGAVTIEIKDGGISFIRITDNGGGIDASQVRLAFLRHATSKIRRVDDLLHVASLGFRGEALSSIAAVCQVELITKTADALTGVRYVIEGGQEKSLEEIGAPGGTTFLVRNLFFNTPARKKFLKTAQTEAGYVSDIVERIAASHPEVSFKFIVNGQTRLHTSGNHNLKDIVYNIYGREIAANLIEVRGEMPGTSVFGFIGKPVVSRGNRNYENYFVNGRYIRSSVISRAIEDAYHTFLMKHKYPFTVLHFTIDGNLLDINVHPTKMELRFSDNEAMYQFVLKTVREALLGRELIPQVSADPEKEAKKDAAPVQPAPVKSSYPEPFEAQRRRDASKKALKEERREEPKEKQKTEDAASLREKPRYETAVKEQPKTEPEAAPRQIELFEDRLLSKEHVKEHRIIGQLFETYWLVQFQDKLFIIDQHAAHEKVLYERMKKSLAGQRFVSQNLNPPIILTLNMAEAALLERFGERFRQLGFEIEEFGGREYALRAVPDELLGLADKELFLELLDSLAGQAEAADIQMIDDRIASMSCKAAVKGNQRLSAQEVHQLIDELMSLENPYNCPHGRPTIISMTRYDLERKFKRIV